MNRQSLHSGAGRAKKRAPRPHATRVAASSGRDSVPVLRDAVNAEFVLANPALPTSHSGETALPEAPCVLDRSAVTAADDASGPVAPGIASEDSSRANCEASAAAALSREEIEAMSNKKSPSASRTNSPDDNADKGNEALKVPTDLAALADGPSYVRAVAAQVDLVGASAKLVVSTDEKIAKAELDRLRELIFGKGGPPPSDETLRIDWTGFPRPQRELARSEDGQGEKRDHN